MDRLTLSTFWSSLTLPAQHQLWLLSGALMIFVFAVLAYRFWRWARGDVKFLGSWYSEENYRKLLQTFFEDQQRGRVLSHHELTALNQFRYGPEFKPLRSYKRGGGYDAL